MMAATVIQLPPSPLKQATNYVKQVYRYLGPKYQCDTANILGLASMKRVRKKLEFHLCPWEQVALEFGLPWTSLNLFTVNSVYEPSGLLELELIPVSVA